VTLSQIFGLMETASVFCFYCSHSRKLWFA